MNALNTTSIHLQQADWLRSLDFYFQELGILKERMPALAQNHANPTMAEDLAYFNDQFYVQQHNIVRLQQGILDNIFILSDEARHSGTGELDDTDNYDYCNLKGKFEAEETTVNALRLCFNKFSAKWM